MCGICGYTGETVPGLLHRMCDTLRHRGPDSEGHHEESGVHLGIRRLAVIDLKEGDQPIYTPTGDASIVYNGEVYNFKELRKELEAFGHTFKTHTDTEVVLSAYKHYGLEGFRRLNGMYAFAIHDAALGQLIIARDPVGIKPLFYKWDGSTLVFGSEVKALLFHPSVSADMDPDAVHLLLNTRFVPGPRTLFKEINQLLPGHALIYNNGKLKERSFNKWSFPARREHNPEEAAGRFMSSLKASVGRQRVADVPLGIYLSGGLDSSSLVAGATDPNNIASSKVRTFSLGFGEPSDELEDAKLVASHFRTDHKETTLRARPLEMYPRAVYHAEAPKVNALQGYYLSKFVRAHATVALSGLGGDELFLGYDIYNYLRPARFLVTGAGRTLSLLSAPLDAFAGSVDRLGGPAWENWRRGIELLASAGDGIRNYLTLRNGWDLRPYAARKLYTDTWQRKITVSTRQAFAPYFNHGELPLIEQVQLAEFRAKMVDDFLWNEDRMSMANSLEVRVPLLDMELIRFAFSLPLSAKFQGGIRKAVMKRALRPVLPRDTLRKKKWGFTFNPYYQFQKDLRPIAVRELTRDFIEKQGIFKYEFIESILEHKPTPAMRWHYFMLWQILGLKFWQEIFLEGRPWQEIEERISRATGP